MTEEKATALRPLWVFGYASLMWNPGFPVSDHAIGTLRGYRRSFCMSSIHHRGTVEAPGLVLALDPEEGETCTGLALRVEDGAERKTIGYLRERELVSSAYLERIVPISLAVGETVEALAYVVDQTHAQYVAHLELEEQAQIIAHAIGGRGPNTEYLWNTVDHMDELGIQDADLRWLSNRVRRLSR